MLSIKNAFKVCFAFLFAFLFASNINYLSLNNPDIYWFFPNRISMRINEHYAQRLFSIGLFIRLKENMRNISTIFCPIFTESFVFFLRRKAKQIGLPISPLKQMEQHKRNDFWSIREP